MTVSSVFIVTDYKTGKQQEIVVDTVGQGAIRWLRTQFPRFTKFVLDGFEINGNYVPLNLWK